MLRSFLEALSETEPNCTVHTAAKLLSSFLGADITIVNPDGTAGPRRVKRSAELAKVLRSKRRLRICGDFSTRNQGRADAPAGADAAGLAWAASNNGARGERRRAIPLHSGTIVIKNYDAGAYQRVLVRISRRDADRLGFPQHATAKQAKHSRPRVALIPGRESGQLVLTRSDGKWLVDCKAKGARFCVPCPDAEALGIWTDEVIQLRVLRINKNGDALLLMPSAAESQRTRILSGPAESGQRATVDSSASPYPERETGSTSLGGASGASNTLEGSSPLTQRVIRELDAQERRRDFVWMGYVAKELLPSLGVPEREVNQLIQRLLAEGIVSSVKRPNPKNPDFPATGVVLNREHPIVKRAISNDQQAFAFPLGKADGELLSARIVRERR